MLHVFADAEKEEREAGKLGPKLVIELREARDDEGNQEDEEADHHDDEEGGVDERRLEFLAEGQRDALEVQIALQDLFEVAGALTGEQRDGVDHRETALRLECRGDGFAGLDAGGDVLKLGTEDGVFLPLGKQFERAEDGKAGADERKKLLVVDEKRLQLDLALRSSGEAGARLDGVNQIAGLREAGAQLLGGRGGVSLLLDAAAFVGEADCELCHAVGRALLIISVLCCLSYRRTTGPFAPNAKAPPEW